MNESTENMRVLLELALNSGNKRKSAQTGYLHHCYHLTEQEPHLPIPLIENCLLALALLRSRTVENIKEAKGILSQLLHFQNSVNDVSEKGNFPVYLHEFPACKDYFIGTHVAFIFCWILRHFHHVLGQDLKCRLEESLKLAARHIRHIHSEKRVSYPIAIKIGAVLAVSGQLLGDQELSQHGFNILDALNKTSDEAAWYCPESLGEIFVSLLLVYPTLQGTPWQSLWDHIQVTWHRETASYAGPSLNERQCGFEPQVTLYDLVCGYYSDGFSDRALKESFAHLKAVLIPSTEERFAQLTYPVAIQKEIAGTTWFLHHGEKMALSGILKGDCREDDINSKGKHPFRLIWGDRHRAHTFVCQGGNIMALSSHLPIMTFDLGDLIDVEDREENREVIFFLDAQEGIEFLVADHKSSTFLLGNEVTIRDGKIQIKLKFSLIEGKGRFLGHRMLGNRPAQLDIKGNHRFQAYDWQVFLRTISRSDQCRIQLEFEINEVGK